MHSLRVRIALVVLVSLGGCLPPVEVDLDGPRIVHSSLAGPRSVEVSVAPELIVEFSEAIDPATVHPGSVVLVAWELLEQRCTPTPVCDEGSCERGRCQVQSLSSSELGAIERGEFDASEPHAVALDYELSEGDTRLVVRARRPLAAHRRHTLSIGPAVRDRAGAPLVDEHDRALVWQRDFVTAGRGSAGPEPGLVVPGPGQLGVATNLAHVETELWPPVPVPQPGATLELEARDGGAAIELVDPVDCPGWVPGTCLRWRPARALEPDVRYRPASGSLVDRAGRRARLASASRETWFEAGAGSDLTPPAAELVAKLRGRCLALWIDAGEPVEATLVVGEAQARAAIDHSGWIGLELDLALAPDEPIAWALELRDLANNFSATQDELPAGPSFDPALPRIRITELLANPSGPEPDAEFVELLAGPEGAALDGLYLADVALAELREAWLAGDEPSGDPLPSLTLAPDELAIVVASGWSPSNPEDPAPAPGTRIVRVDASLGESGLKNAGEPLTLWAMTEQGPAALASYGNWIDTSAASHGGRSVVSGRDGCDLPSRWRAQPQGRSTPGAR
ncbi:hypothetical protein ENSA5_01910 [Enhygromyxa salina]|uniref:SbsA Ig-like domain-containing protein n=1 Tax=Enhygromyxa salina TaxID=215803 RepID=A0A2S9YL82_9BACT|nr:hypothetical protein [Enhygromyxa salina]PRQ05870.1 hypothetical protein ENSA5_01910 [Enhygromyxa salina]